MYVISFLLFFGVHIPFIYSDTFNLETNTYNTTVVTKFWSGEINVMNDLIPFFVIIFWIMLVLYCCYTGKVYGLLSGICGLITYDLFCIAFFMVNHCDGTLATKTMFFTNLTKCTYKIYNLMAIFSMLSLSIFITIGICVIGVVKSNTSNDVNIV